MRRGAGLLAICFVLAFLAPARAYEFDIHAGQRLCFTEDLPEGVNFQGSYAVGGPASYAVAIEIRSPVGVIYSHPDVTEEGRFAFVITSGGSHSICFLAQALSGRQPDRPCRLTFDSGRIPVSAAGRDMDKESTARRVSEEAKTMQRDLQLQREREDEVKSLASGLGTTVVVSSIVCIVVVWAVAIATTQWIGGMVKKRL